MYKLLDTVDLISFNCEKKTAQTRYSPFPSLLFPFLLLWFLHCQGKVLKLDFLNKAVFMTFFVLSPIHRKYVVIIIITLISKK